MKLKVTGIYVDDQEKALRFYTEVLGFVKKTDVSQGPYRWLTVASAEEPDGVELQLALNDDPAAAARGRRRHAVGDGRGLLRLRPGQRPRPLLRELHRLRGAPREVRRQHRTCCAGPVALPFLPSAARRSPY